MVTMADGVSMKIVHSILVTGDVETLLRFLPAALMRAFNMHPRMRALQGKGEDFTAEIHAPINIDSVAARNLLRVRRFSRSEDIEGEFDVWYRYAERECNVGFDRYTQFPFFLTVWANEEDRQARLVLFSDHYMSDGRSGMTVLNCILEQVAHLAKEKEDVESQVQELPLRPSLYEMWLSKKPLSKVVVKGVMALLGKAIYRSEMRKFESGDPARMRQALAKCKEEKVTVGGAMVALIVLAFYRTAKKQPSFAPAQPFQFLDMDCNMRQRVPNPADEDQFAGLDWLANEGVDVNTARFWDLARRSKSEIDENVRRTLPMAAVAVVLDQNVHAKMKPAFASMSAIRRHRMPTFQTWAARRS
ncbi:unnamed protein product [Phytophthora lilii]|uniref:Unnamed protein product n=1 Tax=Phytophthora lilii TaxID=2077276 RepID=A0A9W6TZM2_9STRA|nr:unnamed protein product [Phytophthora lilii]